MKLRGAVARLLLATLLPTTLLLTTLVLTTWAAATPAQPAGSAPPDPARPALAAPASQSPPLRVVGSTPLWAGTASDTVLPTEDAFHELYAGRADLVLGTLPPPPPPEGVARPVSVPVGVYAVSVAYSLPGVALRLDLATLCSLLSGRLSRWDTPAVAALNPGVRLPALPVLVSARTARNGVSLAVAGACVKAGAWPTTQLKANWNGGAAFTRASLGAVRTDLRIPGALAVFALQSTPRGVQTASLRAPGGSFVPPRSELGLSGPRLPGARPALPTWPFGVLHASDTVGAYPLRGLVWASYLPEQAYRQRPPERAQALLALLTGLRSGSGRGVSGLPLNSWGRPPMTYAGQPVQETPQP